MPLLMRPYSLTRYGISAISYNIPAKPGDPKGVFLTDFENEKDKACENRFDDIKYLLNHLFHRLIILL